MTEWKLRVGDFSGSDIIGRSSLLFVDIWVGEGEGVLVVCCHVMVADGWKEGLVGITLGEIAWGLHI